MLVYSPEFFTGVEQTGSSIKQVNFSTTMQCSPDQSIYIEQSVHQDKSIIQPQSILLNAKINQKHVQSSHYVQSEQQSIYFNQSVSPVQLVNEPQPVISNPIVNTIISFTPKQKHVQSIPFVQSVHDILSIQNVQPNANNQSVPQVCPEASINLVKPIKAKSFSMKKHRRGKRNSIKLFQNHLNGLVITLPVQNLNGHQLKGGLE